MPWPGKIKIRDDDDEYLYGESLRDDPKPSSGMRQVYLWTWRETKTSHLCFFSILLIFYFSTPITWILTHIVREHCRTESVRTFYDWRAQCWYNFAPPRTPVDKGPLTSNGLFGHLEDEAENLNQNAPAKNEGQHDQNNQEEEDEEEGDFNEESDDVSPCSACISLFFSLDRMSKSSWNL